MLKYICSFFLLLFIFTSYVLAQTTNNVSIVLPKEIIVSKDKLVLGEIAEISILEALDEALGKKIANVSLGYAPQIGLVREITIEKVRLAIAATGVPNNKINLEMPESILIRRASQEVNKDLIRQEVEKITLSDLENNGATARLVRLDLPTEILVPAGEINIKAIVPPVRNSFAPFIVLIEVWVDGLLVRRLTANAEIEAYAQVVVAKKNLIAGHQLRSEDISIEALRLKYPINQYIRDLKDLKGVALNRSISPNEPILTANIIAAIVIKPGDLVTVIASNGKFSIETKAEAITSGRIGNRIKIKSGLSETLLDAIVIDEAVVKVSF